MRTIWYYAAPTPENPKARHDIPVRSKFLGLLIHNDEVRMYFEVDDSAATVRREFELVGTGHRVPITGAFMAMYNSNIFVWHIYELNVREARPSELMP